MAIINESAARIAKELSSFSDYVEGSATASYNAQCAEAAAILEQVKPMLPSRTNRSKPHLSQRYLTPVLIISLLLFLLRLLAFQHICKDFAEIIRSRTAQLCGKDESAKVHSILYRVNRRTVSPISPSHADSGIFFGQLAFYRPEQRCADKADGPAGVTQSNILFSVDDNAGIQLIHWLFIIRVVSQRRAIVDVVLRSFLLKVDMYGRIFWTIQDHCGKAMEFPSAL